MAHFLHFHHGSSGRSSSSTYNHTITTITIKVHQRIADSGTILRAQCPEQKS